MPEGPEIKQAADKLANVLVGQKCDALHFGLSHLVSHIPHLQGHQITYVKPRAKAMLIGFSSGYTIYSHNQLYGKWVTTQPGESYTSTRQLRIEIKTTKGTARLYSASDIEVLHGDELGSHPFLAKLGPDLLDEETDIEVIFNRLNAPQFGNRRLANLLLDQAFLAGTGNYIRSECLFAAGIHPLNKPGELSNEAKQKLAIMLKKIVVRSYKTKGVCVSDELRDTLKQYKDDFEYYRFAVFGHDERPCTICAEPIERHTLAGRRLYYCPKCQTR